MESVVPACRSSQHSVFDSHSTTNPSGLQLQESYGTYRAPHSSSSSVQRCPSAQHRDCSQCAPKAHSAGGLLHSRLQLLCALSLAVPLPTLVKHAQLKIRPSRSLQPSSCPAPHHHQTLLLPPIARAAGLHRPHRLRVPPTPRSASGVLLLGAPKHRSPPGGYCTSPPGRSTSKQPTADIATTRLDPERRLDLAGGPPPFLGPSAGDLCQPSAAPTSVRDRADDLS
ncbi:hypothetical protein BU16DRAFT_554558 [Lophium mytilinum]|uniref:Uncharacterized protein n=1 Tax=Lophium mytilinum TaxID=390894 RepID=A0A6A6RDM9_9PEZI|nr:hypothetical protein BU16DRAFT_554558 [Lophium mytilinum]